MIRTLFIYVVAVVAFFLTGYFLHVYFLESERIKLNYPLDQVYFFHATVSLVVCIVLKSLSEKEKYFSQIGFLYLWSLLFKLILFAVVFYNPVFTQDKLSNTESISFLFPLVISLGLEVYFLAKILNKK